MTRDFFLFDRIRSEAATWRGGLVGLLCLSVLASAVVLRAGALSGVSPAGASAGITIAITGTGFNATAASNQITFTPTVGSPVTVAGKSVATLDPVSGLRRLQVVVPSGLPVGSAALRVKNTTTGEISQGKTLQILQLQLPATRSGPAGAAALSIRIIGGPNSQFVGSGTRVSLGAGITILTTTVESATSVVVSAAISPSASPGPRTVSVMTGSQTAQLVDGFEVAAADRAPTANPGGPYTGVAGALVGFNGSLSSDPDDDALTYTWNFGDGASATGASPAHVYVTEGTYTVTLTVDDGKGGTDAQSTSAVIVAPNHPPVAGAGGPYTGTSGQPIAFDGSSSSDPDANDTLTYSWSFGDGAAGTGARPTHTYATAGSFTVVLLVNDGKVDSAAANASVTVSAPNRVPVPNAGGPYTGVAGQTLSLDATQSVDPDGDALAFTWDFGDGTQASGSTPTHAFLTVGTFSATLTADDGRGGSSQIGFSIVIAPAPLGRGVIAGRVLDDSTGLALANAHVRLTSVDGLPADAAVAETDSLGRFRLSSAPGRARVDAARDGYTSGVAFVQVADGRRVDPFDVHLTPLDPRLNVVQGAAGGTASNAAGSSRLMVPAGALAGDATLRITDVSPQSLISPLPLGWSPLAAVDVAPDTLAFAPGTLLRIATTSALAESGIVAVWDTLRGAWISGGTGLRSDGQVDAALAHGGQVVLAAADAPPDAPPTPAIGQALTAVAPRAPPGVQVTLSPTPRILFAQPGARSRVTATVLAASPLPSGTPIDIEVAETFSLADGGVLKPASQPRQFSLYRADSGVRASFPVSLSRAFAPFELHQGMIDLAARLNGASSLPHGRVITAAGADVSGPGDERLVIPAGAVSGDVPVDLLTVANADVTLPVPAGFAVASAVTIDLHGASFGQPATLSVVPSPALPAGAFVVLARAFDAGSSTRLLVVAAARVEGTRLVSSIDPYGDGSVRFPGVTTEGRYVFLAAASPIGYLAGAVNGADGSPLANALVVPQPGIGAVTDGSGRYVVAGPIGPTELAITNLGTGDVQRTTGLFSAVPIPPTIVAVGAAFPTVIAVSPSNGTANVPLAASISVTFSRAMDPASFSASAVRLESASGPVEGTFSLAAGGLSGTFRPARLLQSATAHQWSIAAGPRDTSGRPLAPSAVVAFTTIDVTPPVRPAAGAIGATIPDASGVSVISGTQGSAEPGGLVIVRNVRTGALTTITPRADGSFSGIVSALRSDRLELILKDAAGNATTTPMDPFRNADGAVVVGASGGHLEAAGGITLDVPPGALPDGTVVTIAPVAADGLPLPAPIDYPLIGAVRIDLGGVVALSELKVSILAPPSATADDQVLVARAVPFLQGLAWTVEERARFAGGKYTTASPPFVGIVGGGTYAFLQPPGSCTSYVSLRYHFVTPVFLVPVGLPFVVPTSDHEQTTVPARCGSELVLRVFDPDTQAALREVSFFAPAARDDISFSLAVLTDDSTPLTVLSVNNPTDQAVATLEVRFSKALDRASAANFKVQDSRGGEVAGSLEFLDNGSRIVFQPLAPFLQGEQYTLLLAGVKDQAGHVVDAQPMTFTPYGPRSIGALRQIPELQAALQKCGPGGCTTSALDVAVIGRTLFVANGVRTADERYSDPANPRRLLAVDISDPFHPALIGWSATGTNPRALAAVKGATLSTAAGPFTGDLLLVAGGGRVAGGELSSRLEIWDATACGQRPIAPNGNCLADGLKGFRLLSTPSQVAPLPGVPPDSGVPLQIAFMHQPHREQDGSDVLLAYVLVVPIGIELVNVSQAFNMPAPNQSMLAPDGVSPGDFTDLSILKNRVVAVGVNPTSHDPRVDVLTAQLGLVTELPPPTPSGLNGFAGAARVATFENAVFDIDDDGRVGVEEEDDQDAVKGTDELFDLALVASGPLTTGCGAVAPCGELYVLDLSAHTDLAHGGGARVLDRIPLAGAPFSIAIDPTERLAYVELRGRGIATVDLGFLLKVLRGQPAGNGLIDANHDGQDDRVVSIFSTGGGQQDVVVARIKIDAARGLAFVNGAATGVEIVQVANKANELALDFKQAAPELRNIRKEKEVLLGLITRAVAVLRTTGMPETETRAAIPPLPAGAQISVLEQGSGSCFWRSSFPAHPQSTCPAFQPGTSDHDFEVFVDTPYVAAAQQLLNAFVDSKPPGIEQLGDLSLFAMPREPFADAELLNGTPLYGEGVSDATGDLGMGRQSLLLLWLLEGEYVEGQRGTLPELEDILARLKEKKPGGSVPPVIPPTAGFPDEPSGIPRLEGYEWSLLQEFNLYKTGAMLRVRGACSESNAIHPLSAALSAEGLGNDPLKNVNEQDVLAGDCHDEIHSVAKAAIRTAFARIVADTAANHLVLEIDPAGQNDRAAYRRDACFEGPFTTANAPYASVPCTGFEHYIATLAVRAARQHLVFADGDLPQVYEFYCMKVDKCPPPDPTRDPEAEANRFIRAAITFIQDSQRAASTFQVYNDTVRLDTKTIGDIPLLMQGPGGGRGIAEICSGLFERHGELIAPFIREGDPPLLPIGSGSPRSVLRLCNYLIVWLKTNGDDRPEPDDIADPADLATHVLLAGPRTDALKHRLGAKHYVDWKLQVRALNLGARPVMVDLSLYEGTGTDSDEYDRLKTIPVALDAGETQVVSKEPSPGNAAKKRPAFPLIFNLTHPKLSPGTGRAISFFLDPDRTVPEADKKDNAASFVYYVLDATTGAVPSAPDPPAAPIDNVDPDPLAIPRPRLSFDFTGRGRTRGGFVGGKVISVGLDEDVTLKYEVRNLGPVKLTDIEIYLRDLQSNHDVRVLTIPELAPAGEPNDHILLSNPTVFTPTDERTYQLAAHVQGVDAGGNLVGPVYDYVSITGSDDLSQAKIRLFDASALAEQAHPFSRFLANTDNAGHAVPLVGAVTDGDERGGGARVRVEIEGLRPGVAATVSLADAEIPDATDGLGWLESGTDLALQTVTVTPDVFSRAIVYYRPPDAFVRDEHRVVDGAKLERLVRLRVAQTGVGGGVKRIKLRRPPVFLVHGLFSTTDTWNALQPLVPEGGLRPGYAPTPGFDGRFDVFAVGNPETSGSIVDEAAAVKAQIRLALTFSLPGYAVGRVDAIGHSMGSLVLRQIVNDFVASTAPWGGLTKVPFRKLIAMDSPFAGTPLADRIAEIRSRLPVRAELSAPRDLLDVVTKFTDGDAPQVAPEVKVKAKLESCAFMVQSIGLTPKFFLRGGAIDDLVAGSPAILRLQQAGIAVASHHISGVTIPPELGISLPMEALWGTLGYFCNLTPDSTTIEATELFKVGVQAVKLLIPSNVRALKPKPLSIGASLPWARVSDNTKMFLSRVGPVAKFAQKEVETDPTPVFAFENDRADQAGGQLGGIPVGSSFAATSIAGNMDHNTILKTPGVPISACGDLSSTTPPSGLEDLNDDGTPDITCRLIYLLEAAPGSKYFYRSIQP